MRRLIVSSIWLMGLGVIMLYAADFWQQKDFKEWKDKEVTKILMDSPWARSVSIAMGGLSAGGGMDASRTGGGMPGGGGMGGGGMGGDMDGGMGGGGGGGGGGGRRGGRGGGMPGGGMTPTMTVHLRWLSALPVRQALARNRFGDEVESEEASKILNLDDDRYIIAVDGLPRGMMGGGRPGRERSAEGEGGQGQGQRPGGGLERLKERAVLKIKGKEPVHANHIQSAGGGQTSEIYLFFPRAKDGGVDIVIEDKEVEFVLDLERMDIKKKFKLKDMVYNGKLEI